MLKVIQGVGFAAALVVAFVGVASAVVRFTSTMIVLNGGREMSEDFAGFNQRYAAHPYLTLAHIIPGVLFMLTGPFQFIPAIRNRFLTFHRWCGRVYIASALVAAISALIIVPVLPIFGTFTSKVATVFGALLFLFATTKALICIRRREIFAHREWMLRSFAVGLGIGTFRIMLGLLQAPPFRLSFVEAWDTVTWAGFATNLAIVEIWIGLTRKHSGRRFAPQPVRNA